MENKKSAVKQRLVTMPQRDRYSSPWTISTRIKIGIWSFVRIFFFRPTVKKAYRYRLFLLKMFGAKITGTPFVDASAVIKMPWNLTMEDLSCIGAKTEIYNLGQVILKSKVVVAQQAYLCGGTHDFNDPEFPLITGEIEIGENTFIGARAFIMPGVHIGANSVIGACSVVAKDMPDNTICMGNPCKPVKAK